MEKRFVKDYDLTNGELVYNGKEFPIAISPAFKKKAAAVAVSKAALFTLMFLTGEFATKWFPVGIPFTLLIIFIPLFCYNTPRFMKLPFPMHRRHYEGVFTHTGIYAGITVLLCTAVCAAFIAWAFRTQNVSPAEYLFPVFSAGIAVLSALFFREWIKIQKTLPR